MRGHNLCLQGDRGSFFFWGGGGGGGGGGSQPIFLWKTVTKLPNFI